MGYMNPGRWRHIADTYADLGMLPRNFSLDGFIYDPLSGRDNTVTRNIAFVLGAGFAGTCVFVYLLRRRARSDSRSISEAAEQYDTILKSTADGYWRFSERKNAEEMLRKSEERYAMTMSAVKDGLWDWDVPSGSAYFSPVYYAMLGYADREFPSIYSQWREMIHPDDIVRV